MQGIEGELIEGLDTQHHAEIYENPTAEPEPMQDNRGETAREFPYDICYTLGQGPLLQEISFKFRNGLDM